MSNLRVMGITQTFLFEKSAQVTQLVVYNESTGQQAPVTVTEEDAYLVLGLAERALQEDDQEEAGEPIIQEHAQGEQI